MLPPPSRSTRTYTLFPYTLLFRSLAQSVVDRGLGWFGSASAIQQATPINGLEHLDALLKEKRRIILLAPHFIGLDAAATRLTLFLKESATMYTQIGRAHV